MPDGQFYQIRLTFNPVSTHHWIKAQFYDRQDDDVLTHKSTFRDNRFIDEAYFKRMERRKEVDPEGYQIYGLGNWGETKGLIFHNYEVKEISTNYEDYDHLPLGKTSDSTTQMQSTRTDIRTAIYTCSWTVRL